MARLAGVASTIAAMNIRAVRTAPRLPWQNAYVERVIGSIRRECLDHVIVLSAAGLQRVLKDYTAYYMGARTHLALAKDPPITRPPHAVGPELLFHEGRRLRPAHRHDRLTAGDRQSGTTAPTLIRRFKQIRRRERHRIGRARKAMSLDSLLSR